MQDCPCDLESERSLRLNRRRREDAGNDRYHAGIGQRVARREYRPTSVCISPVAGPLAAGVSSEPWSPTMKFT